MNPSAEKQDTPEQPDSFEAKLNAIVQGVKDAKSAEQQQKGEILQALIERKAVLHEKLIELGGKLRQIDVKREEITEMASDEPEKAEAPLAELDAIRQEVQAEYDTVDEQFQAVCANPELRAHESAEAKAQLDAERQEKLQAFRDALEEHKARLEELEAEWKKAFEEYKEIKAACDEIGNECAKKGDDYSKKEDELLDTLPYDQQKLIKGIIYQGGHWEPQRFELLQEARRKLGITKRKAKKVMDQLIAAYPQDLPSLYKQREEKGKELNQAADRANQLKYNELNNHLYDFNRIVHRYDDLRTDAEINPLFMEVRDLNEAKRKQYRIGNMYHKKEEVKEEREEE